MLKALSIENYAIISKVDLEFDASLNIITGETGAGKSILLGALGLIMGQRADSKVLLDKETKCIVEATFSGYPKAVDALLKNNDLDSEEELIIRREIIPSGRSRAFINDTPTNLGFLQKVSLELIDLNQQFQIIEIQNKNFQLNIIDALGKTDSILTKYKATYAKYKENMQTLSQLQKQETAQLKELDFMRFQLDELDTAALVEGEQKEMEAEMLMLEKADEIVGLAEETKFTLIDSETSLRDVFADLAKKWSAFAEVDSSVSEAYDSLEEIQDKINEIVEASEKLTSKVESNPVRLQEVRTRLDLVYTLQKKHGVQEVSNLLEIQSGLATSLANVTNRAETIEKLKAEIRRLKVDLEKIAKDLTAKRKKVFPSLEKEVNKKLQSLSMGSAQIKVESQVTEDFRSDGKDDLTILFKANKGTEFQAIKKVASGGESARLMLSIKATVAHAMSLPTMIFDEIDTGVSGDVAGKMGDILKALSAKHQLLCITHSPQVSSRAVKHFFVYKEESKDRTSTFVKVLDKAERITEIAKMLSGDPPSTFALENAKDLITTPK